MDQRYARRRGARVAVAQRGRAVPLWVWLLLALGLVAAMPTFAQSSGGAPGGSSGGAGTTSPVPGAQGTTEGNSPSGQVPEMVQPQGAGAAIPKTGVIRPPANGAANSTPVLRPAPGAGTMPVIRPPGTPGGDMQVVPK